MKDNTFALSSVVGRVSTDATPRQCAQSLSRTDHWACAPSGTLAGYEDPIRNPHSKAPASKSSTRICILLDLPWPCIYNLLMLIYGEVKRETNIRTHGFDFVGSDAVFAGFTITREDGRDACGGMRLQTLGLWSGVVVFVVHTPRGDSDHLSIRKAEKHEERIYWNSIPARPHRLATRPRHD